MDYWAQVVGDESYRWDSFFPFYKKTTHYTPVDGVPDESINFEWEGSPLEITYPPHRQPQNKYLSRAFETLGFNRILGFNGGVLNGYGFFSYYQDPEKHTRVSSATSYLLRALQRTGLLVYPRTLAQQILFQDGKASGVIVQTAGQNYTISARKEIIISAGFVSHDYFYCRYPYASPILLTNAQDSLPPTSYGIGRWTSCHTAKIRHRSRL
jgi:choline dehydrogenase